MTQNTSTVEDKRSMVRAILKKHRYWTDDEWVGLATDEIMALFAEGVGNE